MSALTTLTRFKTYAGITATAQDAVLMALIPQVSAQIERYLRRTLESTTYKLWIDGSGAPTLRLVQYPITAIYQCSVGSNSVAWVSNSSASVSMASVSCDGNNLVLLAVNTDGTESITELPFATYKTIAALQTQIATLSGWTLSLISPEYGVKPSSLLRPLYGQSALSPSTADLVLPDGTIQTKIVHEDMIEIVNSEQFPSWDIFPVDKQPNRMSAMQPGITPPTFSYGFPSGTGNVFVWFKAGYVMPTDTSDGTISPGLELLVMQTIQDVLSSRNLNSNIKSESIGDYSYTLNTTDKGAVSSAVESRKRDLNQYRRVSI